MLARQRASRARADDVGDEANAEHDGTSWKPIPEPVHSRRVNCADKQKRSERQGDCSEQNGKTVRCRAVEPLTKVGYQGGSDQGTATGNGVNKDGAFIDQPRSVFNSSGETVPDFS